MVPADVAANRVSAPEVNREKLLLSAQQAKRASEQAIVDGNFPAARASLDLASSAPLAMPTAAIDDEANAEIDWLTATSQGMPSWDREYASKRLRSDANRKTRGYKTRTPGRRSQRQRRRTRRHARG